MIISLLTFLLSAAAAYWVYNDTKSMGFSSSKCMIWTMFTFFFWYIALPIYFLIGRENKNLPKHSRQSDDAFYTEKEQGEDNTVDVSEKVICPKCGEKVPSSFSHCQHCGYTMKPQCSGCGRTLESDWSVCPHCGTKVGEDETETTEEQKS